MNNSDKPAYPRAGYELTNLADHVQHYHEEGLTKRELIAMAAMQGMLANSNLETWMDLNDIPKLAVKKADELLKRLEA